MKPGPCPDAAVLTPPPGCRTYKPEEGRGRKNPATRDQAMKELVEVGGHRGGCPVGTAVTGNRAEFHF